MRVSLCVGKYATTPYYIAGLEIPVYSIEELSFCLKENAFLLDMSMIRDELIDWIDKECGLKELAGELHDLLHKKGSFSGFVTLILEYVGFYDNAEIAEVARILRQGAGLSGIERRKGQIDYLVKKKKYAAAIRGYDGLLAKWTELENSGGELPAARIKGALLHNKAVALVGMMLYDYAAEYFKLAYETDQNLEHHKAYLAAKRLELDEKNYIAFAAEQTIGYEQTLELEKKIDRLTEDWKLQPEFQDLLAVREYRKNGNRQLYLQENEKIIRRMKEEYRDSTQEKL